MCQTDTTRPINMFDKNSALTIIYRHEKHTNITSQAQQKTQEKSNTKQIAKGVDVDK